jgi:hypothetical protein
VPHWTWPNVISLQSHPVRMRRTPGVTLGPRRLPLQTPSVRSQINLAEYFVMVSWVSWTDENPMVLSGGYGNPENSPVWVSTRVGHSRPTSSARATNRLLW